MTFSLLAFFKPKKLHYQRISVEVCLLDTPAAHSDVASKKTVTVGDLHASVKRLLTQWTHARITTLKEETYQSVGRVLDNHDEYIEKLDDNVDKMKKCKADFDKEIATLKINQEMCFRSIGDNLADRDANDYFILKLYYLKKNKKILYSNHDAFFMTHYEAGFFDQSPEKIKEWIQKFLLEKRPSYVDQHNSFVNLAKWVAAGVVTPEEIQSLVEGEQGYKSALKLVDYDVDVTNNHISIYSHAPIDFKLIASMANYFDIAYRDETIADLCETINKINQEFQAACPCN